MKVKIVKKGLLITPETDFEADYLRKFHDTQGLKAFLKHGLSVTEIVGIQIELPVDELFPVDLEGEHSEEDIRNSRN